jgi:hypothetical protein
METEDGEWVMMDVAMYRLARKQAARYSRVRVGTGVEEGRIAAGVTGGVWHEVGKRALEMAKGGEEGDTVEKPTWEDVQAHNECVSMVMGLRNNDCHGVPHEREWERRMEGEGDREGPETRSGAWGCMACRGADVEMAAWQRGNGFDADVPAHMPLATVRHWVTGRCAAREEAPRAAMTRGAERMYTAVKHLKGEKAEQVRATVAMAVRASKRTQGISDAEWLAMRQVMAGQLADVEETVTRAGPQKGKAAKAVDAARREMVWGAVKQVEHAKERSWKWETWRREREAHRAWMLMVIRAWKAETVGIQDRRVLERVTRLRRTRWRAMVEAEVEARRRSVRTGRRVVILAGRGSGEGRIRAVRTDEEKWWARLRMKVQAMQAWAGYMMGVSARWVADGRTERMGQGARVHAGGARAAVAARVRGRRVAVQAALSTRIGVRLGRWLEGGEGWDAEGPMSVRHGRRT